MLRLWLVGGSAVVVLMKKIRRIFFKVFLLPFANRRYRSTPASFEALAPADPGDLFIGIVAFNQPELIGLQEKALKKYCRDPYVVVIFDNSSEDAASSAIRDYCVAHRINYVRLPKNPGPDGSLSEGFALNWSYHNVIKRYRPNRFGFIDSDMFPTAPFSANAHLAHGDAWGVITSRRPLANFKRRVHYLWPGFSFFRSERFAKSEPNFLPGWGIDTAGRIRIDPVAVKKLGDVYDLHRERVPVEVAGVTPDASPVYRYGSFVHLVGTSAHTPSSEAKMKWMRNILAQ